MNEPNPHPSLHEFIRIPESKYHPITQIAFSVDGSNFRIVSRITKEWEAIAPSSLVKQLIKIDAASLSESDKEKFSLMLDALESIGYFLYF